MKTKEKTPVQGALVKKDVIQLYPMKSGGAMETFTRYIVKRKDGAYINLRWESVKSLRAAARFENPEDFERFLTGYYAPADPSQYYLQAITIIYQEEQNNV